MSASRYRRWGIAPRRAHLLSATIVGIALWAGGPGLGRASAAPLRTCTPTHGTVVVVDFAHWGGPIVRGCGVGQPTGFALLHAAGFTTAGDEHDGPAVVCRLGDSAFHHGTQYPTPKQDHCVQTPPTTGYWAYWVAPAGTNHWAYSPLGALGDVPKPGEVELWIFGATNVAGTQGTGMPTFSPATLRAHAHDRPHTSTTATTHTSTPTSTTRTTTTTAPRTSTTRATTTRATTTRATTSTPTTSRATATTTTHRSASPPRHARRQRVTHQHRPTRDHTVPLAQSTATTRIGGAKVVTARPASRRASTGSSAPLIIGAALAVLLCVGAARAAWRHRHEE